MWYFWIILAVVFIIYAIVIINLDLGDNKIYQEEWQKFKENEVKLNEKHR